MQICFETVNADMYDQFGNVFTSYLSKMRSTNDSVTQEARLKSDIETEFSSGVG